MAEIFKDKIIKFGEQFFSDKPKTKQLTDRLAHIYAGYVLFYILSIIARMKLASEQNNLPYNQKPRTLWITLMYLWNRVYEKHKSFSEEDIKSIVMKNKESLSLISYWDRILFALIKNSGIQLCSLRDISLFNLII